MKKLLTPVFSLLVAIPAIRANDLIDVSQLGARGLAFETVAKGSFSLYACAGVGGIEPLSEETHEAPWFCPTFFMGK